MFQGPMLEEVQGPMLGGCFGYGRISFHRYTPSDQEVAGLLNRSSLLQRKNDVSLSLVWGSGNWKNTVLGHQTKQVHAK